MKIIKLTGKEIFHCDGSFSISVINRELYLITWSKCFYESKEQLFKHYLEDVVFLFSVRREDGKDFDLYYSLLDDTILGVYNNDGEYMSGVERIDRFKLWHDQLNKVKQSFTEMKFKPVLNPDEK